VSGFLLAFTLAVAALIGIGLHRVWVGPTVFDRLVAIALLTVNGVVLLVLLGFLVGRPAFYLDIALAYALLAFVLPIAVGRYFEQRERPDGSDASGIDGAGGRGTRDGRGDPGRDPEVAP
jgi:multicomponent Na+:H+ antiporter subunit F